MSGRKFPPWPPALREFGCDLSVTRGRVHYHKGLRGIIDALSVETGVISTYRDALMRLRLFVKLRVFVGASSNTRRTLGGHSADTFYYQSQGIYRIPLAHP